MQNSSFNSLPQLPNNFPTTTATTPSLSLDTSRSASQGTTSSLGDPSFFIGSVLESISLQDKSFDSDLQCGCREDGANADSYCENCKEYLCQRCVSAHLRVTLTKDHTIVKVILPAFTVDKTAAVASESSITSYVQPIATPLAKRGSTLCSLHAAEMTLYCDTCDKACCGTCFVSQHTGHSGVYLREAVERTRSNTELLMQGAKGMVTTLKQTKFNVKKMIDKINDRGSSLMTEIQLRSHNFVASVQKMEKELIQQVKQIQQMKTQVLEEQIDFVDKTMLNIESMLTEVELMNASSGLQVFQAPNRIERTLNGVPSYTCFYPPHEDDAITFIPSQVNFSVDDGSFGKVCSSVCARQCRIVREGGCNDVGVCGTTVYFVIHARDHLGNKRSTNGDEFEVTVLVPDGTFFHCNVVSCHQSDDSLLLFNFKLLLDGKHIIRVLCRGVLVPDCPYAVNAKHGIEYRVRARSGAPRHVFGKEGSLAGELCRPWGICSDYQGHLIVADRSNNRIQVFNSDGTFLHAFGTHGSNAGQLNRPAGVAVNKNQEIIVADKDNHRIQIFAFDGKFIKMFGERGFKMGQFNYPWDLDVNSSGLIVVTDTRNHRIQLFTADGLYISKYGFEGVMWKHFDSPRGVAFMPNGRIVVTDFNNHRLVIIQPDMCTAQYLGCEGSKILQFLRPQGVAIDDHGNIVVADSRNHRIQVFSDLGELKAVFDRVITGDNHAQQMDRPSGVAVTPTGDIAVIDFGHHRVLVL